MDLDELEEYAAWINILTFYVSGFFLSKFQKTFLVSEFISNLKIKKIHWFYFVNTCLGGPNFLHPTPLKREKV